VTQPPILIPTCNAYLWSARIAVYLLSQYWRPWPRVVVAGYRRPDWPWPAEVEWHTIAETEWPQGQWSSGLIRALKYLRAPQAIIWLDDYWCVRDVDTEAVGMLADLMSETPDILRCDLTDDRMYAGDARDVGYCGRLDLVETPGDSPYQMSLQAGIWNVDLLLPLVYPKWSPWEFELHGSPTLHHVEGRRVLGTRQRPVRYANAMQGGRATDIRADQWALVPAVQQRYIEEQGWLPG